MSTAAIFTGPWVNHSHGLLIGATLTLKTRDAGFLLAVLVVVVGATGRAFWFIASYVLHQLRCNEDSHDALFYQQQAILKNSAGSLGAAWKFAGCHLPGENTSDHAVGVGEEPISYSGLSYDLLPRQYHLPQTIPFLDIANFPVT